MRYYLGFPRFSGCAGKGYKGCNGGFSLIELLVVISMMTLLVTVVSPASLHFYGKFTARINEEHFRQLQQRAAYEAFIRQQVCTVVRPESSDEAGVSFQVRCADEAVEGAELVLAEKGAADALAAVLPLSYNTKGLAMTPAENR